MATPPLVVTVSPDTAQFAAMLRVIARHLNDAASEIEQLATPEDARAVATEQP